MFFSVITKNLNWEVLTKNLFTFKRWDELRIKNFNIMGVPGKPIYRENFLKREGLDSLQI